MSEQQQRYISSTRAAWLDSRVTRQRWWAYGKGWFYEQHAQSWALEIRGDSIWLYLSDGKYAVHAHLCSLTFEGLQCNGHHHETVGRILRTDTEWTDVAPEWTSTARNWATADEWADEWGTLDEHIG